MQAGNLIGSIVDKILRNPHRVKKPTSPPRTISCYWTTTRNRYQVGGDLIEAGSAFLATDDQALDKFMVPAMAE
jgi:hypothetical protein